MAVYYGWDNTLHEYSSDGVPHGYHIMADSRCLRATIWKWKNKKEDNPPYKHLCGDPLSYFVNKTPRKRGV